MEYIRETAARFAGMSVGLGKVCVLWALGFSRGYPPQCSRNLISLTLLSFLFPLHGSEGL